MSENKEPLDEKEVSACTDEAQPAEEAQAADTAPAEGDIPEQVNVGEGDATVVSPYKNGFLRGLDNFYGISKKKSSFKVEIFAGIATFLAMCYILVVNPSMILGTNPALAGYAPSVFLATAFGAIIGTLLMSIVAKMPYAQAPGMGLNSQVGALIGAYASGVAATQFSFGTAMLLVLISGLIFLLLSVIPGGKDKETGKLKSLREYIFDGIPSAVRTAIPVGIGLFIAYIGFQNAGVIVPSVTQVDLVAFNVYAPKIGDYAASGAVICFIGLIVIAILSHFKFKGAVVIGIIVSTLIAIPFGVADVNTLANQESWMFWNNFGKFFSFESGTGTFLASFWDVDFTGKSVMLCIMTIVSFCMIDMFDTMGTITGCATRAGLLDKNNKPIALDKCMYADSIATCTGAMLGTSTVTTFVESGAGVAVGGKTGMTSLIVAIGFFLSIFIFPVFAFIPSAAAACALVYVGVLMMGNVKNIDFSSVKNAVPAFLTIVIMPLGYSITDGIGVGLLVYLIIALLEFVFGLIVNAIKGKPLPKFDIPVVTIIVAVLFAIYFFVPTDIGVAVEETEETLESIAIFA